MPDDTRTQQRFDASLHAAIDAALAARDDASGAGIHGLAQRLASVAADLDDPFWLRERLKALAVDSLRQHGGNIDILRFGVWPDTGIRLRCSGDGGTAPERIAEMFATLGRAIAADASPDRADDRGLYLLALALEALAWAATLPEEG